MKIKKFRAATMREALEQVKHELGESALVVDTRRVRERGFLGFGASDMIEVRVATETDGPAANRTEPAKTRKPIETGISLTDNAPATPTTSGPKNGASQLPRYDVLAARAAAASSNSNSTTNAVSATTTETNTSASRGVEIAETAPRVVHRRTISTPLAGLTSAPQTAAATATATSPSISDPLSPYFNPFREELERLRAELREVKFSLGSFAARPLYVDSPLHSALAEFNQDQTIYDSPYYETYLELTATGLAPEHARRAVQSAVLNGTVETRTPAEIARYGLELTLKSTLKFSDDPLATQGDAHSTLVFIGPTGIGKTTTIAKLAARVALRMRRRVELITLDTYRIAAVEQLKTYAEIIGAGFHVAQSVVELDALTRRYENEATVLVDTIGRSPQDLADQMELADYLRASDHLAKCLVLPATTHPSDAATAVRKYGLYGADRIAFTKLDETTRPGAVVRTAVDAGLPLVYLCAGQRVPEDLELATPEALAARIVRANRPSLAA